MYIELNTDAVRELASLLHSSQLHDTLILAAQSVDNSLLPDAHHYQQLTNRLRVRIGKVQAAPTLGERLMPGCTCGHTPESNRCTCD